MSDFEDFAPPPGSPTRDNNALIGSPRREAPSMDFAPSQGSTLAGLEKRKRPTIDIESSDDSGDDRDLYKNSSGSESSSEEDDAPEDVTAGKKKGKSVAQRKRKRQRRETPTQVDGDRDLTPVPPPVSNTVTKKTRVSSGKLANVVDDIGNICMGMITKYYKEQGSKGKTPAQLWALICQTKVVRADKKASGWVLYYKEGVAKHWDEMRERKVDGMFTRNHA